MSEAEDHVAIMTKDRHSVEVNHLDPDRLALASDDEFRALVDADLRRHSSKSPNIRPELSAALRRPENLNRWFTALTRMIRSVDGQLEARAADHDLARAELKLETKELESRLQAAQDQGYLPDIRKYQAKLRDIEVRLQQLRATHAEARAKTLRFRCGVDEALVEARAGLGLSDTDHYLRVRELETAIAAHRQSLLDEEIEPNDFDEALWAVLAHSAA